jgi:hypothetical protein
MSQAFTQFSFSEAQFQYFPVKTQHFVLNGWISCLPPPAAGQKH